jgi:hypothetical protein
MFMRPNNPFSQYEVGKLVQKSTNVFVFRECENLLIEVTGYGTENPVFRYGCYMDPRCTTGLGGSGIPLDGSVRWFSENSMNAGTFEKFREILPKFNPGSLKNICLEYISKNLNKSNTKEILPVQLEQELESNRPKF